jgi:hypothetical protein
VAALRVFALILISVLCVAGGEEWRLGRPLVFRAPGSLKIGASEFNLRNDTDLRAFADWLRKAPLVPPDTQRPADARSIDKRDARGLKMLGDLSAQLLAESSSDGKEALRMLILELAHAVANNHRAPIPHYVDLVQTPILLANALDHPVARGTKPAANIPISSDWGRIDPAPSTFWRRPMNISEANLSIGFGRESIPDYSREIWSYDGPKKGGRNAGCELKSGHSRIKIKFAEIHSEPFTARIFDALGYNVLPTDFCPSVRIKYDRRLFTEFNSRREMKMRAGIFFIPIYSLNLQEIFDPLDFIDRAVLTDGSTLTVDQLRQALFKNPSRKHPASDPNNFDATVEARIDYLVTKEVNVQTEPREWQSIGPWDFGALGHENLREVRGAGLVAAWLGWWDSRFENTRLRARKTAGGIELKHYFSDLGGGLGISGGTFQHSEAKVDRFEETFTRRTKNGRFEIVGYQPVDETPAFREMTENDALWMARLMSGISEAQISAALAASGFNEREVEEFTRKLISRRAALLRDLGIR